MQSGKSILELKIFLFIVKTNPLPGLYGKGYFYAFHKRYIIYYRKYDSGSSKSFVFKRSSLMATTLFLCRHEFELIPN